MKSYIYRHNLIKKILCITVSLAIFLSSAISYADNLRMIRNAESPIPTEPAGEGSGMLSQEFVQGLLDDVVFKSGEINRRGAEFIVFTRPEWDFVIKVPKNINIYRKISSKGYGFSAERLSEDITPFTAMGNTLMIRDEIGTTVYAEAIIQKKLVPLDQRIKDLIKEEDFGEVHRLLKEKIRIELEIMQRGLYVFDSFLCNFGVDENRGLRLFDLGCITDRPYDDGKQMRYETAPIDVFLQKPLSEETLFNKRGYVIYAAMIQLMEIIMYTRSKTGVQIQREDLDDPEIEGLLGFYIAAYKEATGISLSADTAKSFYDDEIILAQKKAVKDALSHESFGKARLNIPTGILHSWMLPGYIRTASPADMGSERLSNARVSAFRRHYAEQLEEIACTECGKFFKDAQPTPTADSAGEEIPAELIPARCP